jgi:hypothetical protein
MVCALVHASSPHAPRLITGHPAPEVSTRTGVATYSMIPDSKLTMNIYSTDSFLSEAEQTSRRSVSASGASRATRRKRAKAARRLTGSGGQDDQRHGNSGHERSRRREPRSRGHGADDEVTAESLPARCHSSTCSRILQETPPFFVS